MLKESVIRQEGKHWVLHDSSGKRVLGRHPSRAKALAQERAIQAHKHASARLDLAWKMAAIAVDLDGTLAKTDPKQPFDPKVIGDPVPRMLSRVKKWLRHGKEVDIFTARAADPKNIPPIREWLKEHGLIGLKVTNRKLPTHEEFWDDRAQAVEINTGKEAMVKKVPLTVLMDSLREKRTLELLRPIKKSFVDTPGDYAPGIERANNPGDLSQLEPGSLVDYVIQQHDARRRGRHYDFRMGTPRTGLFSWAGPARIPEPGQRLPIARTNLHRYRYKDFEGEIPAGAYGAGAVSKVKEGQLLITRTTPNSIHFNEASGPTVQRFALIKPPNASQAWLLVRANPPGKPPVEKEHFKLIPPEHADAILKKLMDKGAVAQPKVDGALAYARLAKGRVELMSHRTSKRTGGYIPHTERVFGKSPDVSYPKEYENALLRGEIYGERGGKSIPPQALGGILNSSVGRSLKTQKDTGTNLRMLLFGLAGSKEPYNAQRKTLEGLMPYLPQDKFVLPEEARTYEDARTMLEQIRSGKHPLTHEGIVVHPQRGVPAKIKFRPEQDVYVRKVFPGAGKYEGMGAGGFEYSMEPEGDIVGRVGTGLSDDLRRELFQHPELYLGRQARVAAQNAFPSGALRAPSLIALHEG